MLNWALYYVLWISVFLFWRQSQMVFRYQIDLQASTELHISALQITSSTAVCTTQHNTTRWVVLEGKSSRTPFCMYILLCGLRKIRSQFYGGNSLWCIKCTQIVFNNNWSCHVCLHGTILRDIMIMNLTELSARPSGCFSLLQMPWSWFLFRAVVQSLRQ